MRTSKAYKFLTFIRDILLVLFCFFVAACLFTAPLYFVITFRGPVTPDVFFCYGLNSTQSSVCLGRGNCTGLNNCTCPIASFTGPLCQIPVCYGKNATDSTVCSGKGYCSSPNNCTCLAGSGNQCQN